MTDPRYIPPEDDAPDPKAPKREPSAMDATSPEQIRERAERGKLHNKSAEYLREHGVALCGDLGFTSVRDADEPCKNPQGFGVKDEEGNRLTTGPCRHHTPDALREIAEKKAIFLDEYERTLVQTAACRAAGVSLVQIWRWRQGDDEFDRAVSALITKVEPARPKVVEETVFERVTDPANNADTLRMFYLMNRDPDRWQDRRRHEHTGEGGGPIRHLHEIQDVEWKIGNVPARFYPEGAVEELTGRPAMRQIAAASGAQEGIVVDAREREPVSRGNDADEQGS